MADAADIVIRVRAEGIQNAETALRRLQAAGVRVETVSSRMENGFQRAATSADAFHHAISAIYTVMTVTTLTTYVGGLAKLSDAWLDVTNKLANANSANEQMVDIQERVFGIAQRTRTSLEATSTLYARMERSLNQYGVTGKQVAQITETINKAMIVSGATTAESTAAIIQFSQGLQSGVLRGDEFRSVMEQAPRLGKMIADGLGVGTAGLRQMANAGQLTADVVINSISKAASTINDEFARTIPTFSQRMEIANNNLIKFAGTSTSVQTVVNSMGAVIETATDHLTLLSNTAIGVAAIVGGRMITALAAQIAAFIKLNAIQASSSAINIKTVDSITRSAVARYNEAQATLAQVAAERTKIQAALQANQTYYKGIATLNAYMQNTRQVREATEAVAIAQTTMQARMAAATVASRVLTVTMTGLRTVMGLMGGPVGVVTLAAAAWFMWSQNSKQAVQDAQNLASSQEDLKNKLKETTLEQQRALSVQLQRAAITLDEQIAAENRELAELKNRLSTVTRYQAEATEGTSEYNRLTKDRKELEGDVAIKIGEISTLEQKAQQVKSNLTTVLNNLTAAVMGHTDALKAENEQLSINISSAAGRSQELVSAIQAQNNELDVAQLKMSGHARQASILKDAQTALGKKYKENEKFIKNYISGHADATAVLTDEQQGLVELLNLSGKNYDAQKKIHEQQEKERQNKKDNKAAARYAEQWDKAYERVEARGATGLQRLNLQQEAEVRAIRDKAERAKASEEELQNALLAIQRKYDLKRAELAEQYKPGVAMVRAYKEAQQEINQLLEAGLLTEQQAYTARLNLQADYYTKRAQMQSELNPAGQAADQEAAELATLKSQYETAIELATGKEEQLTAIKENYERIRHDIQLKYAQKQMLAQNQTAMAYIESLSSMAGSMTTIMAAAGDDASGAYRVMFALSKSFSIAQSMLSITTALSQVLADPTALTPMQKMANYATIAAAGANIISTLSSVALTGMAHDGIANVPEEGTWLLNKGERVLSPQQNADFTNFMKGQSNTGNNSGGGVIINQNFNIQGNGDAALKSAVQQAARDGAQQGYNMVLQDFANRGSIRKLALG